MKTPFFDQIRIKIRPAWYITQREVRDQFRDWRIIFPVVGLTLFFPFLMNFTAQQMLGFVQKYGANIIAERLIPFLLMIVGFFPTSTSLVIALETFVGEKERGSIEPLLNTPLEDWQIYLGKLLSATVPPLLGSYLGMIVYLGGLVLKRIPLPEPDLLFLIIILTTVQAIMMVSGAVVVSSQATSVRSANLLASFIIIPVALMIQGESVIMFWGYSYRMLWWAVFGLIILTILLVRVGLAHFQREELLGREIDILNFRWLWKTFAASFSMSASNFFDWYRKLFKYLISIRVPIVLVTILTIAGIWIGIEQIKRFPVPLFMSGENDLEHNIQTLLDFLPIFSVSPVLLIFWQNLRVIIISFILGTISLSILGMLPQILSMGVVGYLFSVFRANAIPVDYFLALVIPHGILEIPATIIATAVVLRSGALLATPTSEKTFGEVFISTIGEWAAIIVGIVVPLLFLAALLEAWVTPGLALWIMGK